MFRNQREIFFFKNLFTLTNSKISALKRGFISFLFNTRFQKSLKFLPIFHISSFRFSSLFLLCRVEPFQVSLFPLFTRHSSFMSSNLFPPPEQRHSENFPTDVPCPGITASFRLSFYIFPYLFSFASIRYRYRIRELFSMEIFGWISSVEQINLYTHIHIHEYIYISQVVATLSLRDFYSRRFQLLFPVARIRGNSFLVPANKFSFTQPFILFLGRTGEICFFSSFFWEDYLQDRFRMERLN